MWKKSFNEKELFSLRALNKGVCVVGENFDGFFFTCVKYSACSFSNLYPFCEVERV